MANQAGLQASIGNGQTMNADAAIYWRLLVAAVAAACGVWVVATEGTRTYARQLYLYVNRNRPGFNPAWSPDSPYAYHLSGRAVDVGSGVGYLATLVSIAFYRLAGLYGFRPTVKGEPWHFEWRLEWVSPAIRAAVGTVPASTSTKPIPEPESEEDDVKHVAIVGDSAGNHWVCDFAQKTRWNVAAGISDSDTALTRARTLNAMGIPWFKNQPASTVAGLTDITTR